MTNAATHPKGDLSLRTVAMPADTNPAGDIFGGWIMSLMDLAAGVSAGTHAKGRVATAAVSNLSFLQPVKVGDVVCVYTDITRTGRTSITLDVGGVGVAARTGGTSEGDGRGICPGGGGRRGRMVGCRTPSCRSSTRNASEPVGAIRRQIELRLPARHGRGDQASGDRTQRQAEMLVAECVEHRPAARRPADHRQ